MSIDIELLLKQAKNAIAEKEYENWVLKTQLISLTSQFEAEKELRMICQEKLENSKNGGQRDGD